jgi:hypothetical protein
MVAILVMLAAGLLTNFWLHQENEGSVYSVPVSVGNKTFVITVFSNYSSAPEVSYSAESKSVLVDFKGGKENSFCNITIPTDLVWGELSVIDKYYQMSQDQYIQSSNGTYNSVYFTFDHDAYVKHFEVRGTEGVTA